MAGKSVYTKIMTPAFRLSFPQLAEPKAGPNGGAVKYGIKMLFPKKPEDVPEKLRNLPGSATRIQIRDLIDKAAIDFWGKDNLPKSLRKPFRDGDTDTEYAEDKGMWIATARSTKKPGIVDGSNREITAKEEIEERLYAGCWCRATIAVGATETGQKCVHLCLNNLQKLKDDTKFGNRKDAKDDFDTIEGFQEEAASEAEKDFSGDSF